MRASYAPPLALLGGVLAVAAGLGAWPGVIPVVSGAASLPVGLGVALVVLGLARQVGGPRATALLLGVVGVVGIGTGAFGYWAYLVEGSADLWG
ncbi:MAG: hypothetical protein ACLFMX_07885, partial [Halobacteriales archaeon]